MTKPAPTRPADKIGVKQFRLILQYPLVLDGSNSRAGDGAANAGWVAEQLEKTREKLGNPWQPVNEPIKYPPKTKPTDTDGGGYGQFAYFHDFAQKFLFSAGDSAAFSLHERCDIKQLRLLLPGAADNEFHQFEVPRLSLHLFDIGVAFFTLELNWQATDNNANLNLAQCQDIIDHIRRTYTPFWEGDTAKRVPKKVELLGAGNQLLCCPTPYTRKFAEANLLQNTPADIKLFEHWLEIIRPLCLLSGGDCWRDPSDERMPINSFITLEHEENTELEKGQLKDLQQDLKDLEGKIPDQKALDEIAELKSEIAAFNKEQNALLAIRDSDWLRLADAEEAGDPNPYNKTFTDQHYDHLFYDRFFPDEHSTMAIRHIIDGPHYCVVGAGWFMDNILIHHFRRHYALLSMIARFEFAVLLAMSSRLTNAVIRLDGGGTEAAFEADIIALHRQFLNFVHRFRFTGVSSQLQPAEMFGRWRQVLDLDRTFEDVRAEVEIAFQRVTAMQQKRAAEAQIKQAEAANDLAKLAAVGVVLGLIAGVLGANIFIGSGKNMSEWMQFWLVAAGTGMMVPILAVAFGISRRGPLYRLLGGMGWLAGVALLIWLLQYNGFLRHWLELLLSRFSG